MADPRMLNQYYKLTYQKTFPVREDSYEKEYRLESAISCAIEWTNFGEINSMDLISRP